MGWDSKTIIWGDLGESFWRRYAELSYYQRRQFLLKYGLQYGDVPKCRKCKAVFHHCYCNDEQHKAIIAAHKAEYKKPFSEKLRHSEELVAKVLEEHKGEKIYLAYSGGIDSECCVRLFQDAIIDGRVTLITSDTLVDFPETRAKWVELEQELGVKITFARPDPGVSYKTITRCKDLPVYARAGIDKEKRRPTELCCEGLKKKNMRKLEKGATVLILGIRGTENHNRRLKTIRYGDYFFAKSHKQWHVYPIAYWTIEDVWEFQKLRGFSYNRLYDKTNCGKKGFYLLPNGEYYQIRTGCWPCPQSIDGGYLIWLKEYFPKFYDAMVNKLGLRDHVIWAHVQAVMGNLLSKQTEICGAFDSLASKPRKKRLEVIAQ